MAAVTLSNVELLTGTEGAHKDRGRATVALVAGDPIVVSATPSTDTRYRFNVAKAASQEQVYGVALHAAAANEAVDFVVRGEIEGFSGLTPGNYYTVASGAIDSTAPATGITGQFYAVTETQLTKLF